MPATADTTKRRFHPAGFFALRTPLLPFDELVEWGRDLSAPVQTTREGRESAIADDVTRLATRIRDWVARPHVREALAIASPSFLTAVDAWERDPTAGRAEGVVDVLVRYFTRMAARATPFGLFSGCSVGTLGETTRLELAERARYRRHTRLDMHHLTELAAKLSSDPATRARLRFQSNSSLVRVSDRLQYTEARVTGGVRGFHLVTVPATPYLLETLERASAGLTLEELARPLATDGVELAEAMAYVEELADSQLLVSELEPAVTGRDSLRGAIATLRSRASDSASLGVLTEVAAQLDAIDRAPLGLSPERYRALGATLGQLPLAPNPARMVQVDLVKASPGATLGSAVTREVADALVVLEQMAAPYESPAMQSFRAAFVDRYGDGEVPLAEVLDEAIGIGFAGASASRDPAPLLEGLAFPVNDPELAHRPPQEGHLFTRLCHLLQRGEREWVLDELDVHRLTSRRPAAASDAVAVVCTVLAADGEAVDRGEFQVRLAAIVGPSGASLLARFCHGDPALRDQALALVAREEALRPEVVFADVVHLPEGRIGNIICRPNLRRYEIPYLGRSGAATADQIPVQDLRVSVRGNRVVLHSQRLGREVVPRLTTAHNFASADLGVYRFLCALQEQDGARLGWSWMGLSRAPFLPRVRLGRVILAPAYWNLTSDDLEPLLVATERAARYEATQVLRTRLGLPRWVAIADGDNVLPIDLDNVLAVESMIAHVRPQRATTLREMPEAEALPARGPEGRYTHELVVPFLREKGPAMAAAPRARAEESRFLPGSEWLSLKLYGGTALADRILVDVVGPVVQALRERGLADRWFFLRYADPAPHLRVRVHGRPGDLLAHVLPALSAALSPVVDGRVLWRMQVDTYHPESTRYGGPTGVALSEDLFAADSDAVLGLVKASAGDAEARWRLTLYGMHRMLVDFGLDAPARHALIARLREGFGAELGARTGFQRQMGTKFRGLRASLERLLQGADLGEGLACFDARSAALTGVVGRLHAAEQAGALSEPVTAPGGMLSSYLHMHAVRMFRADNRQQELVLYDLLQRLYESELARAKARR